nr:SpaA isopeptide-forming pilin-related protein [Weissella diestrammenae]
MAHSHDVLAYFDVTLDVEVNAAAQVGTINNQAKLTLSNSYQPNYSEGAESKTFDVGWQFKKENGQGEALSGAGFILGQLVTAENQAVIQQNALSSSDHDQMTIGSYVYLVHPNPEGTGGMAVCASNEKMTGIKWTSQLNVATTYVTGGDGYFQYCSLPAGQYRLIENIVPSGYTKMDDHDFVLGRPSADNLTGSQNEGPTPSASVITANNTSESNFVLLKNYEKSLFPVTGAKWLLVLVVLGVCLMGVAYYRYRVMHRQEQN